MAGPKRQDTPLVSVRQEDLDKFNSWLDKLNQKPITTYRVPPPSEGNKPTPTPAAKKPPKKPSTLVPNSARKAQGTFNRKKYEEQIEKYYAQPKKKR